MSAFLADLPYLAVAVLLVAAVARTSRDIREERREAKRRAVARHPSRRAGRRRLVRPPVPGRDPDPDPPKVPLSKDEYDEYNGVMFTSGYDGFVPRPTPQPQQPPQKRKPS